MKKEYIQCGDCKANYLHGNLHICDPLMKGLVNYHRKETPEPEDRLIAPGLVHECGKDCETCKIFTPVDWEEVLPEHLKAVLSGKNPPITPEPDDWGKAITDFEISVIRYENERTSENLRSKQSHYCFIKSLLAQQTHDHEILVDTILETKNQEIQAERNRILNLVEEKLKKIAMYHYRINTLSVTPMPVYAVEDVLKILEEMR